MRPSRLAFLSSAVLVLGCGSPPARAPDGTPLAIAPAQGEKAAAATARVRRPEDVGVWLHVEDPDAMVELSGARNALATLAAGNDEVARALGLVDLTKPMDVVLTVTAPKPGGKSDVEGLSRFYVKDVSGMLDALGKEYEVRHEGDRVLAHKKAKPKAQDDDADAPAPPKPEKDAKKDDDDLVCDFGGVKRGAEWAVCGSAGGMKLAGAWLRGGPRPPEEERARTAKQEAEIFRLVAYAKPLRAWFDEKDDKDPSPATSGSPSDEAAKKAFSEVADDLQAFSLELARSGSDLTFASAVRFGTKKSVVTRALFLPTSGVAPTDAFLRVAEDASGSVFLPGGGPLSSAVTWGWKSWLDEATPATRARYTSLTSTITRLFDRPMEGGYGIDAARVRTALAGVRGATKDPKKAALALDRALEGYNVGRAAVEVPAAETLVRAFVAEHNDKEKEKAKEKKNAPKPAKGASPASGTESSTIYAVRTAPAKLALPKGSFVVDGTTTEKDLADPKKTTKSVETMLFVPAPGASDLAATWFVTCSEEADCVLRAKKLLVEQPPATNMRDPLFDRPGLLAAGHATSLMGAFAVHRISTKLTASFPGAGTMALDPAKLAEIEHHLSEPKQLLPYVVYAQERGEGGVVAFEMRGSREAWKNVAEHVGGVVAGGAALAFMAVAIAAAASGP